MEHAGACAHEWPAGWTQLVRKIGGRFGKPLPPKLGLNVDSRKQYVRQRFVPVLVAVVYQNNQRHVAANLLHWYYILLGVEFLIKDMQKRLSEVKEAKKEPKKEEDGSSDDDKQFLMSLLPHLKKITRRKLKVRMDIMSVIMKATDLQEYEEEKHIPTPRLV